MKPSRILGNLSLCGALLFSTPVLWAAEEQPITITVEKNQEGQNVFYAKNNEPLPYTLKVDFAESQNVITDKKLPFIIVVPAQESKMEILRVKSEEGKQGLFKYQSLQILGDCLKARQDNNYLYLLPFKHGTKHQVQQAYDGGVTHVDDSRYAVDIEMPEGTEIYSARAGIVAGVKQDSNRGGMDVSYTAQGNNISIYHADGSIAHYAHLKKNGALVKKGDPVEAGVLIGYSGNTGRTNGPHLHFDVRMPDKKDFRLVTLPVKFLGLDGKAITLEPLKWYYATHPKQPAFPVVFGDRLKIKDYAHYQKSVEKNGKVEIRYDKIDSTYVYFASNGDTTPVELKVTFDLLNMVISPNNPVTLQVPAGQERFIGLIRPRAVKGPTDFQFKVQAAYTYEYREVQNGQDK